MHKERGLEAFYKPFVEAKAQADAERYQQGITLPAVRATVQEGFQRADALLQQFKAQAPPPKPMACKAGCSLCCRRFQVSAAPSEVIHLLCVLKGREDRDAIKARVEAAHGQVQGLSDEDRAAGDVPCPLLEDDKCAVCDDRPRACRACNSIDLSYCRQNPGQTLTYVYQLMVHRAIQAGLMEAAARVGLESTPVELIQALHIGLDHPGTILEFLQGRPPLAQAEAYDAFAC